MENALSEEWRDVVGYEGLYQVSNLGLVKSLNYKRTGNEQIMKPMKHIGGYLMVNLYKSGKRERYNVHRLVAETFIQNPGNLPQVNHKDENKENNCVENLEWCDRKYNMNYGTARERTVKNMTGPAKSKSVLCVETGVVYPSLSEAYRQTGVYCANISACCYGRRRYKSAGGFHWKFV